MPTVGTNELVASKIGTDIVINIEHLKLAIQHAFVNGAADNSSNTERAGWEYAKNLTNIMIYNKERKRGL